MTHAARLPPPLVACWDWQLRAACRGAHPELFFHPDRERGPAREVRVLAARAVCARCPVRLACRRHAVEVGEEYGTWGGLSETDRRPARQAGQA